jgi:glycosyltransferase involved in cell wall biosynthesis
MIDANPPPSRGGSATAIDGLKRLHISPRVDLPLGGPTVSVIIPAMNEARNLPWLAARMPANVTEIVLVDGRSSDNTVEVARALWPNVRVMTQNRRGKGNALACGFHAARGEITVMIDADGSMDPGEIPYFVAALTDGADYAKGSRFNAGGGSADITRIRAIGNLMLNKLTNTLHGTTYTDLCYGYNAFWTRILPVLDLDAGQPADDPNERKWGDGFEVETLINVRVHSAALAITEVASFETPRLHGVSNLNAVSDGLRVLRTIAVERKAMRRGDRLRDLVETLIVDPQAPVEVEGSDTQRRAANANVIDITDRTLGTERAAAEDFVSNSARPQ